ncbi:MAG: class I SAM-dependent methyltransferase [Roseiflexaceae bacterium]|nr:class I SAM-dependent methyltransferase [Roseiflexaceae bacterium]
MTPLMGLLQTWMPPGLLRAYRRLRGDPRATQPFTLPTRTLGELFPGAAGTALIPLELAARADPWAVPAAELLALAAICQAVQPPRVFEIGTYTGESTRVLALNSPPQAIVETLDLAPDEYERRVGRTAHFQPGSAFRYTGQADKIRQHLLAGPAFDFAPFAGACDLVYVDANHTYAAVQADSAQAFKLVRPGGVIIWDDYRWDDAHPECYGVTRALNELARARPIFQIAGTRFAIFLEHP